MILCDFRRNRMIFRHADAGAGAALSARRRPRHACQPGQAADRNRCRRESLPARRRNKRPSAANCQKAQAEQETSYRLRTSPMHRRSGPGGRDHLFAAHDRAASHASCSPMRRFAIGTSTRSRLAVVLAPETHDSADQQISRCAAALSDAETSVGGHFLPRHAAQPRQRC